MTRESLRAALDAAVARLVARATVEGWPIRADHCFLRIAYDNAAGAQWDTVVRGPAWRNLSLEQLTAAGAALARIEVEGLATLDALNALSLRFRGKLRR